MKVDPDALAGIEAKIERAHEHFGFLHHEMVAWDTERPWHLVPEVHDKGRKHFYRLHLDKPIPVTWAVILGEALHDLRSAMEQCVYWLTVDWSGRDIGGTAFPVYTKRAPFYQWSKKSNAWAVSSGMYKIRGIGPGPQAFIEALQPYPQRRADYCFEVWMLNAFWNQDKHRLVHLWGLRFSDPEIRLDPKIFDDCTPYIDRRVLHDRAIPVKIICDPPHPEVKVRGQISAVLAFLAAKRRKGGTERRLWDMERVVTDVIRKMVCAVGNQNARINLDVWTARPDGPPYG